MIMNNTNLQNKITHDTQIYMSFYAIVLNVKHVGKLLTYRSD